jgi:hypothetical protein
MLLDDPRISRVPASALSLHQSRPLQSTSVLRWGALCTSDLRTGDTRNLSRKHLLSQTRFWSIGRKAGLNEAAGAADGELW